MLTSERLCLLLADVSGYTAYLAASEPDRAPALAADLIETVVRRLRPAFRLVKLEGDAAFMVGSLDSLDGARLLQVLEATVAAFRARVRSIAQATTCTCAACSRVPELDLKFVVHVGSVVRQRVLGRSELAGTDAIIAHRLLKATAPHELGVARYALLTDATVKELGIDPAAHDLRPAIERFDFLGDIKVHLLDLTGSPDGAGAGAPPGRRPILAADLRVPLTPAALWDELTSPARRARWADFEPIGDVAGDEPLGVGTLTACVVDRLATVEEILDWRPFESFTRTVRLPGSGPLTARHDLRPEEGGTRLSVRWWGGPATARQAEQSRVRLEQLRRRNEDR